MIADKSVLVIDDDVDFQSMVSEVLNNKGFKVRCLIKGEVNIVSHLARQSDIILLDIQLPGINGIDISRTLKADPTTENIPIILVSGHLDNEPGITTVNAFFEKPFSLSTLLHKINELLLCGSPEHIG
jgi:DNA-binding response OmpR family regulator